MIYRIGNQELVITSSETEKDKGTPNQIVGWRDVAETCKTLHAVSDLLSYDAPFIVDGIARAGFWGAVFRYIWPECSLHLNENDKACEKVLKRNFPKDIITDFDIKKWAPEECDIALLDFDHFTLRILDTWKDTLVAWDEACQHLIIADGACFGFKFGNMKHYGITEEQEYYYLLNDELESFLSKRITMVSKFTNAATIVLEPKDSVKSDEIKFIGPSPNLFLAKGYKEYPRRDSAQNSLDLWT